MRKVVSIAPKYVRHNSTQGSNYKSPSKYKSRTLKVLR
jgi:hypothetical protein